MASLREIKDRIGSVRSTLKITSAMKLVASSKLRKAQKAVENFRPYEQALYSILSSCGGISGMDSSDEGRTAIVAISSNSSLCGGFNANVIRNALRLAGQCDSPVVYSLGRRVADAMKKAGYPSPADFSDIVAHASYDTVASLAKELSDRFFDGEYSRVILVYNHFVSTSRQEVVEEDYLPFEMKGDPGADDDRYIIEPSGEEVVRALLPRVLALRLHAAVLDSAAAEHAARTVAMQTATDNAEELLGELTLEYNKGRQQKITSEILDLLGGSACQ